MKQRDQRKKGGTSKPLKRKLHFPDGEVWTWRFGSDVLIRTPDCRTTYHVPLPEITGMRYDDMERGEWKGWWDGVGPQQVKDYIELHLRPDPRIVVPPRIFIHPHVWSQSRWHLYIDCHFLPNKSYHAVLPRSVAPEGFAKRVGTEPTRLNLCGVCLRRSVKGEAA